jgi:hypothetical protein
MLIEVKRDPSADGCTIGKLFVDGQFQCFTLEDVVREIPGLPVTRWKVQDQTAIPTGTYEVVIAPSPHFGRDMPHIVNVSDFNNVLIHWGNTQRDTEGCILVGSRQGTGQIFDSRIAFEALFAKIEDAVSAGESVKITIGNFIPQRETSVA